MARMILVAVLLALASGCALESCTVSKQGDVYGVDLRWAGDFCQRDAGR